MTTDGSCGANFGNKLCGDWPQGSCCSSYGSCGSSDAHCGDGCQSGPCKDGSGVVVLDPSVWESPSPTAACYPPCTFVFPSQTLSSAQTITVPPATETIKEIFSKTLSDTTVLTTIVKTTTITIPVITTTVVGIYEFNWTDTGSSSTISLTSSVTPPPMTITESSSSGIAGWIWTYHPDPIILPTIPAGVRPPKPPPTVAIKPGPPKPVCKGGNCTPRCKKDCNPSFPPVHCVGICGCIGICPHGGNCVGTSCPKGGADPEDDGGDDRCTSKKTASTCTTTKTSSIFLPATTWTTWSYSDCKTRTGCSVTDSSTTTTKTETYALPTPNTLLFDDFDETHPTVAIDASRLASILGYGAGATMTSMSRSASIDPSHGSSNGITSNPTQSVSPGVTSAPSQNTNFISCSHRNQNPGEGIYTPYCVCDGSTFSEKLNTAVTPYNSCAYTEKPTSTAAIQTGFAAATDKDKCEVCRRVGPNQQDCTSLSNCTPKSTAAPSSTSTPSEPTGPAGGWYVDEDSLTCTSTCEQLNKCSLGSGPSSDDIDKFCKEITDDCADGVLDASSRSYLYNFNGFLATNNFKTGSANGNNGCPNNDDCQKSFKYLAAQMRYPSAPGFPNAYCEAAFIDVFGYYNHERTGSIIVKYQDIRRGGP